MAFRDLKRGARRDLHQQMQVSAYYLRSLSSDPTTAQPIHVRLWVGFDKIGDVKGARIYPGVMQNESDKIRFDMTEIARVENGAIVSIEAGEAYMLDNVLPLDDEWQTAEVTRMTANQLAAVPNLPVPDGSF